MKKNLMMLGCFILLASSILGKEALIVPEQKPEITVLEKPVEVIVYRDRVLEAPAKWRPNGSVDIQYRVYGKTENKIAATPKKPSIPLIPLEPSIPLDPPDDEEYHMYATSLSGEEVLEYEDESEDFDVSEAIFTADMPVPDVPIPVQKEDKKVSKWAREKRYNAGRLQIEAKLNFTEKQSLEIRERVYHTLRSANIENNERYGKSVADKDELRLRHFYRFGNLGSSKVNATSRLEYNTLHNSETMSGSAYLAFDISSHLFQNNFVKTDYFRLGPSYTYNMKDKTHYSNQIGLLLESYFSLPYNFGLELNVHPKYMAYNKEFATKNARTKKHEFYAEMEAKLFHNLSLYKNDK